VADARGEQGRVLIVDDDPIVAESIAAFLEAEGYRAATAGGVDEAMGLLDDAAKASSGRAAKPYQVVISDVSMPGGGGMELLRRAGESHPAAAVVMLTGYGTIESAVEALRHGAVDYLTKPVVDEELRLGLERALRQHRLMAENAQLRQTLDRRYGLDGIVGSDQRMRRVFELVEAVSESKTTVLMEGESGTGKSLIARAIHHRSPRAKGPFVEISCGSIPETLLESELFGHVKGAFTGAHADKPGRFVSADGGTLFLDEINSASPGMQLKLLRVLQERKLEPVGSSTTVEVDVRVILASNEPLERLVADGRFRQDLYYRINVIKVDLPPLRDRIGDVPVLAEHFLVEHAAELGKAVAGFSGEAVDALRRYSWPGNVRELSNVVERAAVLCRGERIELSDLPPHVITGDAGVLSIGGHRAEDDGPWEPMPLVEALKAPERRILLKALEANEWNRQRTAEQLEINRTTLYKKMKVYGIEEPRRAG
jgi:two-component system response regulator AtoC